MKTNGYIRVSSKEQEGEGFSLSAQEHHMREYAERKGFQIDTLYREAKSAKKAGRKVFNEMIESIRKEKEPVRLLIDKTDRASRNLLDHHQIEILMEEKGLELHIVKENRVITKDSPPSEKLTYGINIVMAKHYIDNLSQEAKKGMYEKARQGWMPGHVPHGYKNNKETKMIDVVEDEAILVRRAFQLYATGNYSLEGVSKQLFKEGLTYRANKPKIERSALHLMLMNRFYIGEFKLKDQYFQGKHNTIVPLKLFEDVQKALAKANRPKEIKNHKFLYAGLMTCSKCGCAITAQRQKQYVYYRCTDYKKMCKHKRYIREERLTEMFSQAFNDIKLSESHIPIIIDELKRGHQEEQVFHKEQVEHLNRNITKMKSRIAQIYEDKLDSVVPHALWLKKHNEYTQELTRLESSLADHNRGNLDYIEQGSRLLELAKGAHRLFLDQNSEEKRKFVNLVLLNVKFDGVNLHYDYAKPFDLFYKMANCKEWWAILDSNQ